MPFGRHARARSHGRRGRPRWGDGRGRREGHGGLLLESARPTPREPARPPPRDPAHRLNTPTTRHRNPGSPRLIRRRLPSSQACNAARGRGATTPRNPKSHTKVGSHPSYYCNSSSTSLVFLSISRSPPLLQLPCPSYAILE
jgi:hypothetical protein